VRKTAQENGSSSFYGPPRNRDLRQKTKDNETYYPSDGVHTIILSAEKHQRLLKRAALKVCSQRDSSQRRLRTEQLPSLMAVVTRPKDLHRYFLEYDYSTLLSDRQEFWRARIADYVALLYQYGAAFLLPFEDRLMIFRHVARVESSAYLKEQTLAPDVTDYMSYIPTRSSAIEVCVDRDNPLGSLEESLRQSATIAQANALKPWRVSFIGEAALDLQGPRQEFLTLAAREFEVRGQGITRSCHLPVHGNNDSLDSRVYALLIARAITEFLVLPYQVPVTLMKRILGGTYSAEDMLNLSADKYYGFYCVMLNVGREKFEDYLGLSICDVPASPELDPTPSRTEACPDGLRPVSSPVASTRSVRATSSDGANRASRITPLSQKPLPAQVPIEPTLYATALASMNAIVRSRGGPIDAVAKAVNEFLSGLDLSVFSPVELQWLVSGEFVTTPGDILRILQFDQPTADISSTEVGAATEAAFRGALQRLSNAEAEAFLRFVTGSARIPAGGFQPPLRVQRLRFDGETPGSSTADIPRSLRLPTASTCFHTLKLPPYTDEDTLYKVLRSVCEEGTRFEFS